MFAFKSTLRCVRDDKCVVCAHRLLHNEKDLELLKPNARPETCATWERKLRDDLLAPIRREATATRKRKRGIKRKSKLNLTGEQIAKIKRKFFAREKAGSVGIYKDGQKILTVGDGDFSFSVALARHLHLGDDAGTSLTSTTYESYGVLKDVYPGIADTVQELDCHGVEMLHGINAVDLKGTLPDGERRLYDRIVFNFPCVAVRDGKDGQNAEMEENKALVKGFLESASAMLNAGGEVHIRHKTKAPYSQWGIARIAASTGLFEEERRIVFDRSVYYPYANRKALAKQSFPAHDAETIILALKEKEANIAGCRGTFDEEKGGSRKALIPLSEKVIKIVKREISK